MDEEFDLSSPEAQQSLLDLCEDLKNQDFVLHQEVTCWATSFNAYLNSTFGTPMPLENSAELNQKLWSWATTTLEGLRAQQDLQVGFINRELKYMKIEATSVGDPTQPADLKLPIYDVWKDYLEDFKERAPSTM
mmetsp:Transcript_35748/g.54729  ORF Transcript_35748/g.54729 Transcript_35748/m.54729 type:complete len:134 (-) Transcript_35748:579-980(-)